MTVPATAAALPSVDDIDPAAAYPNDARRLERLRGYVAAGRVVWWRRGSFRGDFRDVEPKWHVFAGRRRSDDADGRWDFTWVALCGWTNTYSDLLGQFRDFKVGTPKKDDRCKKCVTALQTIQNGASA